MVDCDVTEYGGKTTAMLISRLIGKHTMLPGIDGLYENYAVEEISGMRNIWY